MKYLKTFSQLNEAKIQDPRGIILDESWKEASKLKDLKLFEDAGKHEFGCSMVYFQLPLMEALHKIIDEDDIYTGDGSDRSYGLEKEPHTTLLYGLHPEVDDADVIGRSTHPDPKELLLSNVSCFENEDYDVLKFDVDANWLYECNKKLAELPHTNKFSDYHPHATIGYLKKGIGEKYMKMLKGMQIKVMPEKIVYSKANGEKVEKPIRPESSSDVPLDKANKSEDFEYKGYDCRIPYIDHRDAYGAFICKDNKYIAGLRGWLPLEKAKEWAKDVVDRRDKNS